jgi:Mitochondrial K+-H+ exchange-related
MNVFLVPVASDRYALYCEEHGDQAAAPADAPLGFVRRAAYRFRQQIAEAEKAGPEPDGGAGSWAARLKLRSLRWAAESMAEQRLLWQLRGTVAAILVHPDDLTDAQARQLLNRSLRRDWERHRFWLVIDGVCGLASLLLVVIPGPNVVGYYFLFRIVGHALSLRGARQGLSKTVWTMTPHSALTMLRSVVRRAPADRADIVVEVASNLRLEHLAKFFDRCATPGQS